MKTIDDLKFVRIRDAGKVALIPKQLFEQIDAMDWGLDETLNKLSLVIGNDLLFFYVMLDEEAVQGFLWLTVNMFKKSFFVKALSVNKEYKSPKTIKTIVKMVRDLKIVIETETGVKMSDTLEFATRRPAVYERQGFKRSPDVIMEINYASVMDENQSDTNRETSSRSKESAA